MQPTQSQMQIPPDQMQPTLGQMQPPQQCQTMLPPEVPMARRVQMQPWAHHMQKRGQLQIQVQPPLGQMSMQGQMHSLDHHMPPWSQLQPMEGTMGMQGQMPPMLARMQPPKGQKALMEPSQGHMQPSQSRVQPLLGQMEFLQGKMQPPLEGQTQPPEECQMQALLSQMQPLQAQMQPPLESQMQPLPGQMQPQHGQMQPPLEGQIQPLRDQMQPPLEGQMLSPQGRTQPLQSQMQPLLGQMQMPPQVQPQPPPGQIQPQPDRMMPPLGQTQPPLGQMTPPPERQMQPLPERQMQLPLESNMQPPPGQMQPTPLQERQVQPSLIPMQPPQGQVQPSLGQMQPPQMDEWLHQAFEQSIPRRGSRNKSFDALLGFPSIKDLIGDMDSLQRLKIASALISKFVEHDAKTSGHAARDWPGWIKAAYPQLENVASFKQLLFALVARCIRNRKHCQCNGMPLNDFLENMAGTARVTLNLLKEKLKGVRFDKIYTDEPEHDILDPAGLRMILDEQSLAHEGAMQWLAPRCGPFTILCRGPSGRSKENMWIGDESKHWVLTGNQQMSRAALLYLVGACTRLLEVLEQPVNSVMPVTPPLRTVLEVTNSVRQCTWHGAFGGKSPKPLALWCTSSDIKQMKRKRPLMEEALPLVPAVLRLGLARLGLVKLKLLL